MRRARLVLTVVIISVLLIAVLSALLILFALSKADSHDPISIYGDNDFTKANGVRSGSGTEPNPYVIEGWRIKVAKTDNGGIRIQNTNAFFVIRSVIIEGEHIGILIHQSHNGIILDCSFEGLYAGLSVDDSANISARGNLFLNCIGGIDLSSSVDCSLESNTFETESWEVGGLRSATFGGCVRVSLLQNKFNTGGIELLDMYNHLSDSSRNNLSTFMIGSDNVVDGAPIHFYADRVGLTLENCEVGQLLLANCSSSVVREVRFVPAYVALGLAWCSNVSIVDCAVSGSFRACLSDDITVDSCRISDSWSQVIYCSRFEMTHNNISGSPGHSADVDISVCDNFTIAHNNITQCDHGISVSTIDNATIVGNTIQGCGKALYIFRPLVSTHIYHNNFIDDEVNVEMVILTLPSGSEIISWTDVYPNGGNYWSDYSGVDMFQGPNQDQPGSDGIGDTPYHIGPIDVDQYPLVNPSQT